ncbi:uncharacterized protein LOC133515637 [Cydia pomonella]|uniref:uncharacterized protein LOC133515637 n=1 Tax=Cydia pomonella TaxID=82600 RepID=UPI002ADD5A3F|nr:uncharacterized protein LOC133515637 [Cydia pomonella]
MGKRKHKDRDSHIRRKIRRLQERLRYNSTDSESGDTLLTTVSESHRSDYSRYDPGSPPPDEYYQAPFSDESDDSILVRPRSTVCVPRAAPGDESGAVNSAPNLNITASPGDNSTGNGHAPSTNGAAGDSVAPLPDDILAALGDPQDKDEKLGPKISEEISERWGRIIVNGLTKEQRQDILEKALIPENFLLLKAPQLNPEIAPILSETVKNRDKSIEKIQQHLGIGIAALSNLTSQVIKTDINKIEMLRNLSQVSNILSDLHYENTMHRRKLVSQSLDKNFHNIVKDVKRDAYLFGVNLGEKIKTSKTAERSGLQIKRSDRRNENATRKYTYRENWRGPPRRQGQGPRKQGGPRNRYYNQRPYKRPPPVADRPPAAPKPNPKNPKT